MGDAGGRDPPVLRTKLASVRSQAQLLFWLDGTTGIITWIPTSDEGARRPWYMALRRPTPVTRRRAGLKLALALLGLLTVVCVSFITTSGMHAGALFGTVSSCLL
jgi:hypothetical protein